MRRMMIGPVWLLCLFLLSSPAYAQPSPAPFIKGMKKLGFLVGKWEGSGWIQFGPGKRETFLSSEEVTFRLGGTILFIEGQHFEKTASKKKGKPVHQAIGILSHDPKTGGYLFSSWLANGMNKVNKAKLKEGGLVWFYQDPRSKRHIRFTIKVEGGKWIEVGESSADEKNWHRFFEMTLVRK